ncbi:MAG: hypothetical protein NTY22_08515 [Proteobacteria bacterium]|nr:hypothetical protein [Pseudomonadota bacterium]
MKLTNILSVLGLIISCFFFYTRNYFGIPGPSYHPNLVNIILLISFAVSYIFSLMDVKTTVLKIMALLVTFLGCAITGLFSLLILLDNAKYPEIFNVSGAYIEFVLFLVLMYKWAKQK